MMTFVNAVATWAYWAFGEQAYGWVLAHKETVWEYGYAAYSLIRQIFG